MSTSDRRARGSATRHGSFGFLVAVIAAAGIAASLGGPCPEAGAGEPTPGLPARRQPNVLVLMADHVNARVVAADSQCLKPTLDRLASGGVRFSRC